MILAVKNFKPYIFGMKFTIITYHSSLKALKEKANLEYAQKALDELKGIISSGNTGLSNAQTVGYANYSKVPF